MKVYFVCLSLILLAFSFLFVMGPGCTVADFDPKGYACKGNEHCLVGYHCVNKICVSLKSTETPSVDGGEGPSLDGGEVSPPEKKPLPESTETTNQEKVESTEKGSKE